MIHVKNVLLNVFGSCRKRSGAEQALHSFDKSTQGNDQKKKLMSVILIVVKPGINIFQLGNFNQFFVSGPLTDPLLGQ